VLLSVATCQFPVSSDISRNTRFVLRQMRAAKRRGAKVAHFPEACLSGYAGVDLSSLVELDWRLLEQCTRQVLDLAAELRLWVVVGSAHRLTGRRKPHNCLYVVDDRGALVERYDKMFCAGDRSGKTGDLAHYSPGDHFCVFDIASVRCGALICHDYRYPELYRQYKRRGVQLMFHSYHAGGISAERYQAMRADVGVNNAKLSEGDTLPAITMPATMRSYAANCHVWISCPNSSARHSCWPSFFVRPDGVVVGKLRQHRAGVLVSTLDTDAQIYDSTVAWRDRAIDGVLHSGKGVRDARSIDRNEI